MPNHNRTQHESNWVHIFWTWWLFLSFYVHSVMLNEHGNNRCHCLYIKAVQFQSQHASVITCPVRPRDIEITLRGSLWKINQLFWYFLSMYLLIKPSVKIMYSFVSMYDNIVFYGIEIILNRGDPLEHAMGYVLIWGANVFTGLVVFWAVAKIW